MVVHSGRRSLAGLWIAILVAGATSLPDLDPCTIVGYAPRASCSPFLVLVSPVHFATLCEDIRIRMDSYGPQGFSCVAIFSPAPILSF